LLFQLQTLPDGQTIGPQGSPHDELPGPASGGIDGW